MKIWKYEIEIADSQTLQMPAGAKILDAQIQQGRLNLWALVDTNMPTCPRLIAIYGTGYAMPEDPGQYIATIQSNAGLLVWHVFDASTYL